MSYLFAKMAGKYLDGNLAHTVTRTQAHTRTRVWRRQTKDLFVIKHKRHPNGNSGFHLQRQWTVTVTVHLCTSEPYYPQPLGRHVLMPVTANLKCTT